MDLLLWTAGVAIVLTCYRRYDVSVTGPRLAVWQAIQMLSAFANGLAIASLALFLRYAFRRPCVFPRYAGHWLLLAAGVQTLCGWPAYFAAQRWLEINPIPSAMPLDFRAQLVQGLIVNVVGCVIVLLASGAVRELRWRMICYGWFALGVLELLSAAAMLGAEDYLALQLYQWSTIAISALSAVYVGALVIAAARDRDERRDWFHFAGVAASAISFSLAPVYYTLDAWLRDAA